MPTMISPEKPRALIMCGYVRNMCAIFLLFSCSALAEDSFVDTVRPLLKTHCFKCHGLEKTKGKVNLVQFEHAHELALHDRLWQKVIDQLESGEMPPDDEPQPGPELLQSIRSVVDSVDLSDLPVDPGHVGPHRLNRHEYVNTLRDLLGVEVDRAQLPADGGGGEGFDNTASALFLSPLLLERYLRVAGDVADSIADIPDIPQFARLAYRRPLAPAEISELETLPPRHALIAILCSPRFLFRSIEAPDGALSSHELASRLAYFLTTSMPDSELRKSAEADDLRSSLSGIEAQARRLLRSPQSARFVERFTSQWLKVNALNSTVWPERHKFPHYDEHLRDVFYQEPIAMFAHVMRENLPVTELISADYSFVNQRLAGWYGLKGVKGKEFRKVVFTDGRRGGLLGMGGIMAITSFPLRSSPVLRGKWVLDELLGAKLPPPPPNIESLPADDKPQGGLSIRQRLEQHRERAQCAGCHAKMDPIGFALENFDPVGSWREEIHGVPVDTAGKLPSGETFRGPAELKKVLAARQEAFARNIVERLLAYALGRGIEPEDTPAIRAILEKIAPQRYRLEDAVIAVVQSVPFRHQRASDD
ncbi:MAG: hypothetical protein ACI8W8_000157 [Rhodothermales bacterium]|jgi:hypothetical protein